MWSAGETVSLSYPARYLFTFLDHHGMLAVSGSPHVAHGRRRLAQLRRAGGEGAHRGRASRTPVRALTRTADGVEIRDDADAVHRVRRASWSPPTPTRRSRCSPSPTAAERDAARRVPLLAQRDLAAHRRLGAAAPGRRRGRRGTTSRPLRVRRRAGAGQLRHEPAAAARRARRLRGHAERRRPGRPATAVLARMRYEHPVYTPGVGRRAAPAAGAQRRHARVRRRLPRLGLPRGRLRGRRARRRVAGRGVVPPRSCRRSTSADASAPRPPRSGCTAPSRHRRLPVAGRPRRAAPAARAGCGRSPGSTPATTSATRDRTIRQNLDAWLARPRASTCAGGRVLMLANARVLGYVFNPLTVYWCHRADGALACVVAEVHNTYGERHCYLLRPDDAGRAEHGEGLLRLAVPRRRRASTGCVCRVPDERLRISRSRCASTAPRRSSRASSAARRRATPARARCAMLLRRPLVTPAHRGPDPPPRHRAVAAPPARRPPAAHAPQEGVQ